MTNNAERPEYSPTEPVSSNVEDDTVSSPLTKGVFCTSSQCRRQLLSERHFHDHFAVSVPWSPAIPHRAPVVLADIDEDRPLPPSETLTHPERSLSARELRMQSREAAAESSFNQLLEALSDAKLDSLPQQLKTLRSNISLPSIDETKGTIYHCSGDQ